LLNDCSLQCPQQPVTLPYPKIDKSRPRHPILFFEFHFNIILPSI